MRDAYGGIPSGRLRHDSVHTYRNNRVHIYRHAGCAADESCEQEQNGRPGFGFDSGGLYSVRSIFCTIIFYAAVCSDGIQKEKIHGVEDGCSSSGDSCIGGLYFKDKTYSTRDFLYPGGCTSHGFCNNAFVFHRAAFGVSDETAQHEGCVHGA